MTHMPKLIRTLLVAIAVGVAAPAAGHAAVVRTTLKCSGAWRNSYSTAVPPYTGYFDRRVAYYDAAGARLWLSVWVHNPAPMSPEMAAFGGYPWWSGWVYLPTAYRALVLYRDADTTWHGWSAGGCGR